MLSTFKTANSNTNCSILPPILPTHIQYSQWRCPSCPSTWNCFDRKEQNSEQICLRRSVRAATNAPLVLSQQDAVLVLYTLLIPKVVTIIPPLTSVCTFQPGPAACFMDTQGQLINKGVGPCEMGIGFGKLPGKQMGETIVWNGIWSVTYVLLQRFINLKMLRYFV